MNVLWGSISRDDLSLQDPGHRHSRHVHSWEGLNPAGEAILGGQDVGVAFVGGRERTNEVNGPSLEGLSSHSRPEDRSLTLGISCITLAGVTGLDHLLGRDSCVRGIEPPVELLKGVLNPSVSSLFMHPLHEVVSQIVR